MNLVVIDNKPFKKNFRKYLLLAAQDAGGSAIHLYWGEEVFVTHNGKIADVLSFYDPPAALADRVARLAGTEHETIILVGLGLDRTAGPFVRQIKQRLSRAKLYYDVFDYFRYGARGRPLLSYLRTDLFWRRATQRAILLDPGLKPLYPFGRHLGNASNVTFAADCAERDHRRLVYIGSIDRRVDFDLLDAIAGSGVALDIYGRIHDREPRTEETLRRFLQRHKTVAYKGGYDNDDLPTILKQYRTGLIPYKARDTITKHINPDKIYHYLNAGLEVIATPIPQIQRLAPYVHVINSAADFEAALDATKNAPRQALWPRESYTWAKRWKDLMVIK